MDITESKKKIRLHDKSENTYKLFDDVAFIKHSAYQSLFNGSIIRNSYIDIMDFSRCDFEGTIFEKLQINETNFFHTYFQTAIGNSISFDKCSFETAKINNTSFNNCRFKHCSFSSAVLNKCNFKHCLFKSCEFVGSNITLCKFYNCEFTNIKFGDCSFYQQIMLLNQYRDVSINLDSLGQVFGFNIDDIMNFKYIFLGNEYGYAKSDLLNKLSQIYDSRKWFSSKIIYEYNINKISNFELIQSLNEELIRKITVGEIIKQTDIDFFINIVNELKDKKTLPFFALYLSVLKLKETVNEYKDVYYNEIIKMIDYYITVMISVMQEMVFDMYNNSEYISSYSPNQRILFTIHYEGEKNQKIYEIIEETSKMFFNAQVVLQEVRKGTIIEIMLTTVACIFIFQLCLYGINGCLIQITDMKSKLNILKKKNLPQDYMKQSMLGNQKQPELFKMALDKLDSKTLSLLLKIFSKCKNLEVIEASFNETDNGQGN